MATGSDYFDREYFELHSGKRRYLEYLVRQVRRAGVETGDVLDVGAGFGFFLRALDGAGYRAVGLELSPYAAARVRGGPPVAVGSAEERFPFRSASFDAVTMLDVIEHLRDYEGALRECARVLRPDGRLLVITLNRFSAARPILGRRWSWYQDPTHVHMFSVRRLRRALVATGFECRRTTTLWNFCSVGETSRALRPLRVVGRVLHAPAFGDAMLLEGVRQAL